MIDTLREVDVFFPSELEIQGIANCQDVAAGLRALDNGHTLVIGKLGSEGCLSWHDGALVKVEAFPVQVVDTTGAGDSFDAGFLHAWLRGQPLTDCMRFAAACGALSTRGLGGTATQPTEEEVEGYVHARSGY